METISRILFSYTGRVVTAIIVLAVAVLAFWSLYYYKDPVFLLGAFPAVIGVLALLDAVKKKKEGFFDADAE